MILSHDFLASVTSENSILKKISHVNANTNVLLTPHKDKNICRYFLKVAQMK